jgi:ATP-dependent DNA helicase RecG
VHRSSHHKGINDGINSLLELIRKHPGERLPFYSQRLPAKSLRNIERWMAELKREGKVEFKGSKKAGGYFTL